MFKQEGQLMRNGPIGTVGMQGEQGYVLDENGVAIGVKGNVGQPGPETTTFRGWRVVFTDEHPAKDASISASIRTSVATAKERERLLIQRLKDETNSQEIYDLCSKHLQEMAS